MLITLFFATQSTPASAAYVNLANVIGELWTYLGAQGPTDAVYWTDSELYRWADEAAKHLARECGVFTEYNQTVTAVAGQPTYTLPANHISVIQVDYAGAVLRPRTIAELDAYDDTWPTRQSTPVAFVLDGAGLTKLRLYGLAPSSGSAIGIVRHVYPGDISATASIVAMPPVLKEFFRFQILAEARSKECPASMPEAAAWYRGQAKQIQSVAKSYWGSAQ